MNRSVLIGKDKISMKTETATFSAGCFWGVEDAFRKVNGVVSTCVGYMGGAMQNPSYEDVCTDKTGHVEVVQIEYDILKVSYEDLLNIFWEIHDPTQLNRQGDDIGTQYRSVIFYHTREQQMIARQLKDKIEKTGKYKNKIVTKISKAKVFYMAEEYHQQYFKKQGRESCIIK